MCIFFLSSNVLHCTGRRVIARPHTEPHSENYRPADYYFARKVTEPCGVARDVWESVSNKEVINMVHIVREEAHAAKMEMVSFQFKVGSFLNVFVCESKF